MKLCIVSDSHDRAQMLAAAVSAGRDAGAEAVIHCGDVIGTHTLKPLLELGLPVHVIHGNNLGDAVSMFRLCANSDGLINYHGPDADLTLGGRRIFVTHYPHYGHAMACAGNHELVCFGHSHVASFVQQPNIRGSHTWLVNPGTVAAIGGPATWLLADLDTFTFEIREVKLKTA
jgi:putative phosphoesterase